MIGVDISLAILARGSTLAVQMPHHNRAPSHRVWLSLVEEFFPGRIEKMGTPGVMAPSQYEALLDPLGRFRLWETEYYRRLMAEAGSHPVRRFTESTYARPVLAVLDPDEKDLLIRRYEEAMAAAYPLRDDGSVLFPFRRLFFTLTVQAGRQSGFGPDLSAVRTIAARRPFWENGSEICISAPGTCRVPVVHRPARPLT